jgi:hypothetical protein
MSRPVKIILFGLLGGLVCAAVLRGIYPGLVQMIGSFVFGFLVVALLANFATKGS